MQDAALLQVLRLQSHRALLAELLREQVVQGPADHGRDQGVVVPVLDVPCIDVLAVADDLHAVAELKELLQLVGDEDDADASVTKVAAGLHQLLDLLLAQRGGRLVHDDHLGVDQDRLRDLDHLLHAHAEGARRLGRVHVLAQGGHDFLRLFVHISVVQEPARTFFPLVDKDIVRDGEELLDVQLLVDARDARRSRFVRVVEGLQLAFDIDLALIRLVHAGEHLDQGRFARAVLADQAQDLSGLDRQLHLVERLDSGKYLCAIFQFHNIFAHSKVFLSVLYAFPL